MQAFSCAIFVRRPLQSILIVVLCATEAPTKTITLNFGNNSATLKQKRSQKAVQLACVGWFSVGCCDVCCIDYGHYCYYF